MPSKKITWPLSLFDVVYDISMDLGRDRHFFDSKKIYKRLVRLPFFQEEIEPLLDNKHNRFRKYVSMNNAINYRLNIMEKRRIIERLPRNRFYSILDDRND